MSQDTTDPIAMNPLVGGSPGGAPEPAGFRSVRADPGDVGELSDAPLGKVVFDVNDLNVYYGSYRAVRNVNIGGAPARDHRVHRPVGLRQDHGAALLQPHERPDRGRSGRGRDQLPRRRTSTASKVNPVEVRRRIGMVFQKPNPFPKSIYDNVAYGPRIAGIKKKAELDDIVERALRRAALWDEVKDRLKASALGLSGGQQQRLCIARAVAVDPEVILMDEPCSALDPIATARIEDLMQEIKTEYTIVIVTHNMQQAARVSDRTAFFTDRGQPESATSARVCSSSSTAPRRSSRTPRTSAPRTTSPDGSDERLGRRERPRRGAADERDPRRVPRRARGAPLRPDPPRRDGLRDDRARHRRPARPGPARRPAPDRRRRRHRRLLPRARGALLPDPRVAVADRRRAALRAHDAPVDRRARTFGRPDRQRVQGVATHLRRATSARRSVGSSSRWASRPPS